MKIDVWSDVICPFCYIGKRKLEKALAQTGIQAEIEWHSFEINPDAPRTYGVSLPEVMNQLYGFTPERAQAVLAHEEQEARRMGLDFQWRNAKPGNTFDAHRLIHLAKTQNMGEQAKERFLRAYFTEGKDIGDTDVLRDLALEIGLSPEHVDEVLKSNLYGYEVRTDEQQATQRGIRGVPYFLINGQAVIAGAREVETFVKLLTEQQKMTSPKPIPINEKSSEAENSMCHDGFCEVRSK